MKKIVIHKDFVSSKEQLSDIIEQFGSIGNVFGNQNRNTIRVVDFNDIQINIKSFKQPNFINKIVYSYFRKSKAERSYTYAGMLESKGIGTPQPIAYFEFKDILGLTKSYYISEHINALGTYRDLVENTAFPDRELILRGFTQFTHKLQEANILFNDHSPGNTLFQKGGDGQYNFYLVDLNRMQFNQLTFEERMKNFSRLTPQKEMVAIMSDEYAKISGENYQKVFDAMWSETAKFQEKFFRKRRIKKQLFFWKKYD